MILEHGCRCYAPNKKKIKTNNIQFEKDASSYFYHAGENTIWHFFFSHYISN